MKNVLLRYGTYIFAAIGLVFMLFLSLQVHSLFSDLVSGRQIAISREGAMAFFIFGAWTICTVIFTDWRVTTIRHQQLWLIDVVNTNFARIKGNSQADTSYVDAGAEPTVDKGHWPWGNHTTDSLRHLEVAAKKWWVLYDPSDLTTAPTNEMVSEWLQIERGISREKARAIASMLRPDGLPTGPRR